MASTIIPFRSPSLQPTRRRALAQLATGATVASIPGAGLTAELDPHPAWFAEWEALVDWCNGPDPGDRELKDCPEWHRSLEVEDLIASTPARTLAGAVCQLRLARHYTMTSFPDDSAEVAVANALSTLERLAEEVAHA